MKLSMILAAAALAAFVTPALADAEYRHMQQVNTYGMVLSMEHRHGCAAGLDDHAALTRALAVADRDVPRTREGKAIARDGFKFAFEDGVPSCAEARSH